MMANIQNSVAQIRQAIYGEEIRESIATSIEAMNEQCEESAAGCQQAIISAESAVIAANSAVTQADTAAGSANAAADRANTAAEAIEDTDVGDLSLRLQTLEGEVDSVSDTINSFPQLQDEVTQLQSDISTAQTTIDQLQVNKVEKVEGQGLSSNDFTDTYKDKVDSAPSYKEYDLELINGAAGELRGYRIGNLCKLVGYVTIASNGTVCELPAELALDHLGASALTPIVLPYSVTGGTYSINRNLLSNRQLNLSITGTDIKTFPCFVDLSYPAP